MVYWPSGLITVFAKVTEVLDYSLLETWWLFVDVPGKVIVA